MCRSTATVSPIFLTTHYIEEAQALCDRVGIIDHGRLIALGSPLELRQKLGMVAVEMQGDNNGTKYQYFSDRAGATRFVQDIASQDQTIIIRESNLEDVFVELTGKRLVMPDEQCHHRYSLFYGQS